MSKEKPDCSNLGPGVNWAGDHFRLYNRHYVTKNYQFWPLFALQLGALSCMLYLSYRTLFRSTIDVQCRRDQRFEVYPTPDFFDLRNPRNFKLIKSVRWEPAIHIDNRYRLMRHEPMLDAEGKETDQIGEDNTAPDWSKYF